MPGSRKGIVRGLGAWMAKRDIGLMRFFNNTLRCRILDVVVPRLTHLGSAGATIGSIIALFTWGNISQQPGLVQLSYMMSVSTSVSHGLVHVLKRRVNRPRPELRLPGVRVFRVPICAYSFPSGHTAAAFAIGLPFAWALSQSPQTGAFYSRLVLCWAYLIGFSRVYLGVHYPSDVLAGAFLGAGGAVIARSLLPL